MSVAWSPDRRAEALLPQRADLLRRLPLVAPSAVQLSEDERELVVDEALGYVVLEYEAAIGSATEAEEVFWTAARLRVARTLEGRNALVRGRFSRASEEELDRVPDSSDDPAALVERALEIDVATEFAATLAPVEGQVLRVKWLSDEKGPLGYRKVAESLGITPARARSAERAIAGKLDRFATLLSGGRLCSDRADDLATLVSAAGQDNRSVRAARAHIKHCPVCKADFVAQRRALRSAAFQRDVASVIPALPIAEAARRHGGAVRDLLADWVGRLGGTDAAPAVAQTIASGVGRGAGGVLAVKIVAVLAGGAAVIGGATQIFDGESRPATPQRPPAETATPRPSPTTRAKPEAPATQSAQRRRAQRSNARTQGGTGPRDQEQAPASDAPAGSQPAGGSEFNPDSAALPPAPPAPAPAAPGASEFP